MSQTKKCGQCAQHKPLDAFYKNKNGLHGRAFRCKPCELGRYRSASNLPPQTPRQLRDMAPGLYNQTFGSLT